MVSLGCSKNQVDAERMLYQLVDSGMVIETDPDQCEVMIINTCGFIEAAKQESIDSILEYAQLKDNGVLKALVVTGCLAQRYQDEIGAEIPEADVILGIGSNKNIVRAIKSALEGKRFIEFAPKEDLSLEGERILANDSYFAYLKIAEGCDNCCTYCAIPMIRGRFRSRTIEDIVEEAKALASQGVTELNVVAQDTTRYGEDLYGKLMLPELLEQLVEIEGIKWIRLLYCYPERITDELIDIVKNEDKIVKYFDIPLQHASDSVLKRMGRKSTAQNSSDLIKKIREEIPNAIIRTTLIAGFPGETEDDFEQLCNFVKETKFQRLGCFAYSLEDNTPAEKLTGHLDEEIKQRRAEIIMDIQMEISREFTKSLVGKELTVLVEGFDEPAQMYYGRSYMDAPEVDNKAFFKAEEDFALGDYVNILITDSLDYDLIGEFKEY